MDKGSNGHDEMMVFDESAIGKGKVHRTASSDGERTFAQKYELTALLRAKLLEMPDVLEFIVKLQTCVERQRKKIKRLKQKLKKGSVRDENTQTMDADTVSTKTISEEIKEAAELAMKNTSFAYEETSGLYYDYQSGYYYNAEYGLYYDGNTGTYMTYNADKQTYEFHSKVQVSKEISAKPKRKKDQGNLQENKRSKRMSECEEYADLEEGECSDNSCGRLKYKSGSSDDDCDESSDVSKHWPPCMRIIIEETTVASLKVGSLYVLTFRGGTMGREGDHDILIPDINVSKHHLKFLFDDEMGKYLVVDLGSRNGTLLNGKRMAASKQESEPQDVMHGSRIQVGSTVLLCHVHTGSQTCGLCEPGLVQGMHEKKEVVNRTSKNQQHKEQLKNLRKKFGVHQADHSGVNLALGYTDRAQVRRETVGSQNEHEKTHIASLEQSISSENKGFKLLSKMGWSEGQSLGKDGKGMLEPIKLVSNPGTSGMGNTDVLASTVSVSANKSKKNVWSKTQRRYEQLKPDCQDIFHESD